MRTIFAALALAAALIPGAVIADGSPPVEPDPRPALQNSPQPPARINCRTRYRGTQAKVACVLRQNGMSRWTAFCIIKHESGWNVWARGRAGEYGLFQIHPVNWAHLAKYGGRWWDPVTNTAAAISLYRASGYSWWPWTTYRYYCS